MGFSRDETRESIRAAFPDVSLPEQEELLFQFVELVNRFGLTRVIKLGEVAEQFMGDRFRDGSGFVMDEMGII